MTQNTLIGKILVPTDGSDSALSAAKFAAEITRSTGAQATILYALPRAGLTQFASSTSLTHEEHRESSPKNADEVIAKTKLAFLEADAPVHSKIVEGPTADVILQEAHDGDYDLIVLGSHGAGMSFVERVVTGLGSVAQRVVASADCAVLITRA